MSTETKNITIAVDAGHGSNTPGKRTPSMPVNIDFEKDGKIDVKKGSNLREHTANVGVCVRLEKELMRCGFQVFKTGWNDENSYDDKDPSIVTRQKLIRKAKCQYSVSIHFNAYGNGKVFNSANGVATYYHGDNTKIKDSKNLAIVIQKHLAQGTKQKNRGVNRGNFGMVNCNGLKTTASVLVELAFMTNEEEAINMMGNEQFWKECAVEICMAFCEYLDVKYIEEPKEQVKPKVLYRVKTGIFRLQSSANKHKEKLVELGYKDAYIKTQVYESGTFYVIVVGTFSDIDNAKALVEKLAKQNVNAKVSEK